jgi:plastocyanin domain-containing protein
MKRLLTLLAILAICGCMENVSLTNPTGKEPQTISSEMGIYGFTPNSIQLQRDTPVVWKLYVLSLNACTNKVIIEGIGEYPLKEGDNIIEFTPSKTGEISFNCGMNMLRGKFVVQ